MNHILPKTLKERHFISYSVLTVSYYLMLGHTSGVLVANEVYAFLLVNEQICINCHHLYQSLQRLPALNPNQTSYRETYWSLRLLHFCAFALLQYDHHHHHIPFLQTNIFFHFSLCTFEDILLQSSPSSQHSFADKPLRSPHS